MINCGYPHTRKQRVRRARSALAAVPLRGNEVAKGRLRDESWSGHAEAKPRSHWAAAPARANTRYAAILEASRGRLNELCSIAVPHGATVALTLSGYKFRMVMSFAELDYTGLIIDYRKRLDH